MWHTKLKITVDNVCHIIFDWMTLDNNKEQYKDIVCNFFRQNS